MKVFIIRDSITEIILAVASSYRNAEIHSDRLLTFEKIRSYISVEYV